MSTNANKRQRFADFDESVDLFHFELPDMAFELPEMTFDLPEMAFDIDTSWVQDVCCTMGSKHRGSSAHRVQPDSRAETGKVRK